MTRMQSYTLLNVFVAIFASSSGMVYKTPCQFVEAVRKLHYNDVYEKEIALITCIAGYRNYDTSYRLAIDEKGAGYFGIFGLHSADVKKSGCIGREPNMTSLLDEHINDDFYCMRYIILSSKHNKNFYERMCGHSLVREVPCPLTNYVQGLVYDPTNKNLLEQKFAATLASSYSLDFPKPCQFVEAAKKLYFDNVYEKQIHLITCIAGYRNYNYSYRLVNPKTNTGYFGIFGLHSADVEKTGCIGPQPNMTSLLDEDLEDDFRCLIEIILHSKLNKKFYQEKCSSRMVRKVTCAITNYVQEYVYDPTHKHLLDKEFAPSLTSPNSLLTKACQFVQSVKQLYYDDIYEKEIQLVTCIAGYRNYNTSYRRLTKANNTGYFGIFGLHSSDVEKTECLGRHPNTTRLLDEDIADDFQCMVEIILNSKLNKKFYEGICSPWMVRKVSCAVTNYVQAFVYDPLDKELFDKAYKKGTFPTPKPFYQYIKVAPVVSSSTPIHTRITTSILPLLVTVQ